MLIRNTIVIVMLTMVGTVFLACGGGGGGGGTDMTTDSGVASGTFLDSAVEGLHYETATQSGYTDMDGTYYYREGETIRFHMGSVLLGEAMGQQYMTPVDLVPGATDETHPTVTNICRLLQTVDEDGDPSNGIYVPHTVDQAMMGSSMSFDTPIDAFEAQPQVQMVMGSLHGMGGDYAGRMMVSADNAQSHMRSTLSEMMQMMDGTHPGVHTGMFLDSAVDGLYYETPTQSGVTDMNGTFTYMDGEMVRFHVGDVLLGEAPAEAIMTPVDLVPGATDETHPVVTNICRFLQTLDEDGDPANGIYIPDTVIGEMQGRHIDFDMPAEQFAMSQAVTTAMHDVGAADPSYSGRMMVSIETAQAHMNQTLTSMHGDAAQPDAGNHGGNMPGDSVSESPGMPTNGNSMGNNDGMGTMM